VILPEIDGWRFPAFFMQINMQREIFRFALRCLKDCAIDGRAPVARAFPRDDRH
jgi:hypothetical protein